MIAPGTPVYRQGERVLIYDGVRDGIHYAHAVDTSTNKSMKSMPIGSYIRRGNWQEIPQIERWL